MQRGGQWLVLHHVPPSVGPNVSGAEREAAEILTTYEPDYFLSGHFHQHPYLAGNCAVKTIGRTTLLVPGQLLSASHPSTITLDTETGEALWHTASREWIPETLNDRFVLKFE